MKKLDAASRPFRVYAVGGQATGKTRLIKWISQRFGLPLVIETARTELVKLDETMNIDKMRVDIALTTKYQHNVFDAQIAVEKAMRRGAFDRAFLDNLGYLAFHGEGLSELVKRRECRLAAAELRRGTRAGDTVVFFVRPNEKLLKQDHRDGLRAENDLDIAGVHSIDGAVAFMLELWDIRYVPVESYSFRERTRLVERVLAPLIGERGD